MREGALVMNRYLRGSGFDNMREALLTAARADGLPLEYRDNASLSRALPYNHTETPAYALFFDKDIRLALALESAGARVFNSARAIAVCDDKTLTHLCLSRAGLPMPETVICPWTFENIGYTDFDFLQSAGAYLGYPLVIKAGYGSFGSEVYLAKNEREAAGILSAYAGKPALMQRFIAGSMGRDARVYVVGKRAVAAITRENDGDFRANIASGGRAIKRKLSSAEEELAVRACEAAGLDFAGVDLLLPPEGPLVCEINSNAHFTALREATGVNPADEIIRYMRRELKI